jgi:hypothetical protein
MNEKTVGLLALIGLVSVAAGAHVLAWRSKRLAFRRGASLILAVVSALAAFVGTAGYAIPALADFHDPAVSFRATVTENLISWAICLGAWAVAVRFAIFALRKSPAAPRGGQFLD